MALLTTLQKLENVQQAIAKAERAAEVGRGGFRRKSAELEFMYAQEEKLLADYNIEQGNGANRTYASNRRRFT